MLRTKYILAITFFCIFGHLSYGAELLSSPLPDEPESDYDQLNVPYPPKKFNCLDTPLETLVDIKTKIQLGDTIKTGKYRGKISSGSLSYLKNLRDTKRRINDYLMVVPEDKDIYSDILNKIEKSITAYKKKLKDIQLCIFRKNIRKEIKSLIKKNDPRKKFLKDILAVSQCFENSSPSKENKNWIAGIFKSIFQFFHKKQSLSNKDCMVLKRAYQMWASLYADKNQNPQDQRVPLYNVNAHNNAYLYWLKEKEKGNIPKKGLPLFHFDTHTDMGHVHDYSASHWSSEQLRLSIENITELLTEADNRKFRRKMIQRALKIIKILEKELEDLENDTERSPLSKQVDIDRITQNLARSESFIQQLNDLKDENEFAKKYKEELRDVIRERVHQINQPLTAASISKIMTDMTMVLPPWSLHRAPLSPISAKGKAKAITVETRKLGNSRHDKTYEMFVNPKDDPKYTYDRGYRLIKDKDETRLINTHPFRVARGNREKIVRRDGRSYLERSEKIHTLDRFVSASTGKEKRTEIILDIDLDFFVSNGPQKEVIGYESKKIAMPPSYLRNLNHTKRYGAHLIDDIEEKKQTKEEPQILSIELKAIKDRIEEFTTMLKKSKGNGVYPRVITIADSTLLEKAIYNKNKDLLRGGNFTPSCLVFLLNYLVRMKLAEVYNVKNAN